ncbi:hypothetical protein K439DRAFT_1623867 [Ramaria rubella]|nr:hypothetical protein K439DRAFT_1623867 [Ramaria rubella]
MSALAKKHCLYSKDLKQLVVYQRHTLSRPTTVIAKELDMSLRVIQLVRNPGLYAKKGRARLLHSCAVEFMLGLVDQQPDIYLDEIAEELIEQHGVSVSLAAIQRTMKLLGITTKRVWVYCSI